MTVALETIRSLRAVTPQNTIIEAQHVGQRFTADNGTELTVFDNISFNLYEARSWPFWPFGCRQVHIPACAGRTGQADQRHGQVSRQGPDRPESRIALVFQTFALMPWLTVQDNVELGLKARGVPRAERTKLALDAIDMIAWTASNRRIRRNCLAA